MASALVNNVALSPSAPETFPWIGPRISFSHDGAESSVVSSLEIRPDASLEDFEFCLHDDPAAMLPADELFSEGKLMPLKLSASKSAVDSQLGSEIGSPEIPKTRRKAEIAVVSDPYGFSPRAPRCTTRWRELLGLKRASVVKAGGQVTAVALDTAASAACKNAIPRSSLKHLLHRYHENASADPSLFPLLRGSDHEPAANSFRLSQSSSSSSSGPDHEDLERLSIVSDKPGQVPPRVRLILPRPAMPAPSQGGLSPSRRSTKPSAPPRVVSVDSPRMSSSGKIVFQGLVRSSSSPGSFRGGPRPRPHGVERSYSANVRVAPVLNVVPVCSLRGSGKPLSVFGLIHLFSAVRDSSASNRADWIESVRRQQRQESSRHVSPKIKQKIVKLTKKSLFGFDQHLF